MIAHDENCNKMEGMINSSLIRPAGKINRGEWVVVGGLVVSRAGRVFCSLSVRLLSGGGTGHSEFLHTGLERFEFDPRSSGDGEQRYPTGSSIEHKALKTYRAYKFERTLEVWGESS
jgi:hypothetical protein